MHIFSKKNKGFTLIELLVVLVIMSVITLVFVNRQSKFDSSTLMRSLAYSIALSVRQAQVYGISVRPQASTSGVFSSAHGLYFWSPVSGSNNQYIMFADANTGNSNANQYIAGSDPIDNTFKLNSSFVISEFCAIGTDSGSNAIRRCSGTDDTSGSGSITSIDIMFKRPNPDAIIYAYQGTPGNTGTPITGDTYTTAYIQVQALDGTKRGIHIYTTGQVSVDSLGFAI